MENVGTSMTTTKSHLTALIQDILDEKGWSQRELARRSDLPPATVQKVLAGPGVTPPKPHTLERLAYGLGVSVAVLSRAAAEDTGYVVNSFTADDVDIITASLRELPEDRRREIAALVQAMLRTERA